MRAVLFVDDDPNVLQGLQRMLRPMREEWMMQFVGSGAEALALLDSQRFDVIITDIRMKGMSGTELLEIVLQRHPSLVRIALSGHTERDAVVRTVGLAHQYLSKPCDAAVLKEKLDDAFGLKTILDDVNLKTLIAGRASLPSVPQLYTKIVAEVQGKNPSSQRIGDIIAQDPAMTARVLQLVNSAYFGLRGHVSSPTEAVQLMGLEFVTGLVLSVQVFSRLDAQGTEAAAAIWRHSVRTAKRAADVARLIGLAAQGVNEAFTAGLLHDAGTLLLADSFPEHKGILAQARRDGRPVAEAERQAFGADHGHIAGYLFALWGLPYGIVEAVAWHHRPSGAGEPRRTPLTAVHLADALDHDINQDTPRDGMLDEAYLASLGLLEKYCEWKAAGESEAAS